MHSLIKAFIYYFISSLLGIRSSRTSIFKMSAIRYKTEIGGCTLLEAYRLTMLKVFPSLFANSVWLMPFASNISFIRFIFAFFCLTGTKLQNFIWYIFVSQKKVLILQIEQELFDRNKPHIAEFVTVSNSLPRLLRNAHKKLIFSNFWLNYQILVAKL